MNIISWVACNLPLVILSIIGIGFLIVFHEFGHFLFAKLFNVYAPSFSIGFGPRLVEKKIGETTFAISAIPLGGYVEMAGSPEIGQGEQLHAHASDDRSFNSKPYWQKLLIMLGGIAFNLIFAYTALIVLSYLGSPCIGSSCSKNAPIIYSVQANTPAHKANLKAEDKILSIDNQSVHTIGEVNNIVKNIINKESTIEVQHKDGTKSINKITVEGVQQGKKLNPRLGFFWYKAPVPFIQSLKDGINWTNDLIGQTFGAIAGLAKSTEGLGGPLALIAQVKECAGMGFAAFIFILAFISVNLAVFNLLPLPIFDGGQVLFYTIEAITQKPLSDKMRYNIHYANWLLVLALVAYLTYKDIFRLLGLGKSSTKTEQIENLPKDVPASDKQIPAKK